MLKRKEMILISAYSGGDGKANTYGDGDCGDNLWWRKYWWSLSMAMGIFPKAYIRAYTYGSFNIHTQSFMTKRPLMVPDYDDKPNLTFGDASKNNPCLW